MFASTTGQPCPGLLQVPRLRTAVLGMGLLPASLPATVERLGVVGEPSEPALSQAYAGLQALLPQVRLGCVGGASSGCSWCRAATYVACVGLRALHSSEHRRFCSTSPSLQLPNLKELRFTSGQPLPDALAGLLPPGCSFSTAGVPREGPGTDCWGRSLHQTAPVSGGCGWAAAADWAGQPGWRPWRPPS